MTGLHALKLTERFPDSRYLEDAQLRMSYILNSLANYEVHVARYYYYRGAYLAAANRAQQAVLEYQRSPAAEEGLFIMIKAYEKMGLTPLRDDAERVLKQNYPSSEYLRIGFKAGEKAWWQLW